MKHRLKRVAQLLYSLCDRRYKEEMLKERVIFNRLKVKGFLDDLAGKRCLEIGPKHGKDSKNLLGLSLSELVMIDLPSKDEIVKPWLEEILRHGSAKYIEGNIQYLPKKEFESLGKFDLIWCTGVIYHNQEQLRLLKRLFDLCNEGGKIVLESEIPNRRINKRQNVIEIHWPRTFDNTQTIVHLPSVEAMKSWLEMVGFREVKEQKLHSSRGRRRRGVVTGIRNSKSKPFVVYGDEKNPQYTVGDAL